MYISPIYLIVCKKLSRLYLHFEVSTGFTFKNQIELDEYFCMKTN